MKVHKAVKRFAVWATLCGVVNGVADTKWPWVTCKRCMKARMK